MKQQTTKPLKIINFIALIIAAVWLARKPDYEPTVTFLVLIATLVGIHFEERRSKRPLLKIHVKDSHPYVITEPANAENHAIRCLSIGITNTGDEYIEKCLVKLEKIKSADGRDFKNVFTPVGLVTQHLRGQNRKGGRFNLSPDETKYILVACLNETEEKVK